MNKMIELNCKEVELVGGGSILIAAGVIVGSVILARVLCDRDKNSFNAKLRSIT